MNSPSFLYFTAIYIYCIFAAIIFMSFKYYRKRINFPEVINVFIITSFLRIFDILTTINFAYKSGIDYEFNTFSRTLMEHIGIIPGMTLTYILILPVWFCMLIIINLFTTIYQDEKENFPWELSKFIIFSIAIIVPLHNLKPFLPI